MIKTELLQALGRIAELEQQVAALTKERNHLQSLTVVNESLPVPALRRQLAAAQARESRLREALEYFGTLKLSDGTYADKNCVAVMALTLPTDDSALKERLEEEMGNADVTGLAPEGDKS